MWVQHIGSDVITFEVVSSHADISVIFVSQLFATALQAEVCVSASFCAMVLSVDMVTFQYWIPGGCY